MPDEPLGLGKALGAYQDLTTWVMEQNADDVALRIHMAEAEVKRLRGQLAAVQAVYDLQAPLRPRSDYVDKGAYWAHRWWLRVLGRVLEGASSRRGSSDA